MSSLDDVFERMTAFRQALVSFSEHLNDSRCELSRYHERIEGIWDDSTRRQYDEAWLPLEDVLDQYVKQTCPNQLEFVDKKLSALDDYLHNRRQ